MYVYTHVCIYMYTSIHRYTDICTDIIHTYIYKHIHIHILTRHIFSPVYISSLYTVQDPAHVHNERRQKITHFRLHTPVRPAGERHQSIAVVAGTVGLQQQTPPPIRGKYRRAATPPPHPSNSGCES